MEIVYKDFSGQFDEITEIENESFTCPWTEEMFRAAEKNECSVFLTATCSDRVCGYILANIFEPEAEILSIAVKPQFRGLGIGKELMKRLMGDKRLERCTSVYLEVRISNKAAISLYEKMGFRPLGIRRNYYRSPREDAAVMGHFRESEGNC